MLALVKSFFDGLSAKEKKMVYAALAVIGVLFIDRLVVGPINSESKVLDERIRNQIVHTEKNIKLLAYRERILEEDMSYSEYYTEEGLSREVLIATFLGEVENMAKNSGVALSNIDPVAVEPKDGYTEFSLVLECQGSMRSVVDFLYNIDNAMAPVRVKSFDISVRNREKLDVRCGLTVMKMIIHKAEMAENFKAKPSSEKVVVVEKLDLE
jgi:hypothetical protein